MREMDFKKLPIINFIFMLTITIRALTIFYLSVEHTILIRFPLKQTNPTRSEMTEARSVFFITNLLFLSLCVICRH